MALANQKRLHKGQWAIQLPSQNLTEPKFCLSPSPKATEVRQIALKLMGHQVLQGSIFVLGSVLLGAGSIDCYPLSWLQGQWLCLPLCKGCSLLATFGDTVPALYHLPRD